MGTIAISILIKKYRADMSEVFRDLGKDESIESIINKLGTDFNKLTDEINHVLKL